MAACPHCQRLERYTDPQLQVRCVGCFNVLNDQAPGTPIGAIQDLDAPMVVHGHVYHGVTGYQRGLGPHF